MTHHLATPENKNLVVTLYRLANWAASPRCLKLVEQGIDSRFPHTDEVIARLRKDMLFQAAQSYGNIRETDAKALMRGVSGELTAFADSLCQTFGITLKQSDKRFQLKKGEDFFTASYQAFNLDTLLSHCSTANTLSRQMFSSSQRASFNSRNMMNSLGVWLEALHTLAYPTGSDWFEKMLASLMVDPTYFVRGYPHDILAHDKRCVALGQANHGIIVRKEFASSAIVQTERVVVPEGFAWFGSKTSRASKPSFTTQKIA